MSRITRMATSVYPQLSTLAMQELVTLALIFPLADQAFQILIVMASSGGTSAAVVRMITPISFGDFLRDNALRRERSRSLSLRLTPVMPPTAQAPGTAGQRDL